jgi:hypothetical protein
MLPRAAAPQGGEVEKGDLYLFFRGYPMESDRRGGFVVFAGQKLKK